MIHRIPPKAYLTALAGVAALVAPLVMNDLTFLMRMVLAAIVVTGLSLLMGYAGQASLGQGTFVAAGALTVAVGTTRLGLPPLVVLFAAPLIAGTFALIVGPPLLRLRGHYLAFGTLALLLIVQTAISAFDFLGGAFGISGIPPFGVGTSSSSASCRTSIWPSAAWPWSWCSPTGSCTAGSAAACARSPEASRPRSPRESP